VPVGDAEVRFLINEIVCGEESDVDPRGGRIAHFDLYLRAMHEAGSDTSAVDKALASVRTGGSTASALVSAGVPAGAAAFSGSTFALATNGKSHEVAAAFTFGREDLIPDMFTELVTRLSREHPGKLDTFRYYLERHIEVDGGHHGAISLRMVELLCGDDDRKWAEAADASVAAIESRIALWDAIAAELA
jgi:pyrroloquinoline quinone (PQQ) biosynthesis protein C